MTDDIEDFGDLPMVTAAPAAGGAPARDPAPAVAPPRIARPPSEVTALPPGITRAGHLEDAPWLGRAVLCRVFLGEPADLGRVSPNLFGEGTALARLWQAAADMLDAEGELEPGELARRAGVSVPIVAALIDTSEQTLIRSAREGLQRLVLIDARRTAARFAEGLPDAILNGDGVETLASIGRYLNIATGEPIERLSTLDEVATRSADELRATRAAVVGEAVALDWRTAPAAPGPVPGFLQAGDLTLWSAAGGVGKSLLVLELLVRLAAGEGESFLEAWPLPAAAVRVVLIEAECGSRRLRRRLQELVVGGALTAAQVDRALPNLTVYPAEALRDRRGVLRALPAIALLEQAEVVVIDPLRVLLPAGVDENDNIAVGAVLDDVVAGCARFEYSALVVDHDGKAGQVARGASAKTDAASFVVHITKPDVNTPTYLEVRTVKGRDPGGEALVALERIEGPRTELGLRPVRFDRVEVRSKEKLPAVADGRRATVLEAVRSHYARTTQGIGVRELARALGLGNTTVQRDVDHLVKLGALHRPAASGQGKANPVYPASARPGGA